MPSTVVGPCEEMSGSVNAKAKAAKRKAKSPKKSEKQVIVAHGVPLTRCVGKRKVAPPESSTRTASRTEESSLPQAELAKPSQDAQDTQDTPQLAVQASKKGKGVKAKKGSKVRSQGSKDEDLVPPTVEEPQVAADSTDSAEAQSSTTAVAPGEVKMKKLKVAKSKAKAKGAKSEGEVQGKGEGAETPKTEESAPESRSTKDKVKKMKGKVIKAKVIKAKAAKAQIPIRRLLLPSSEPTEGKDGKVIDLELEDGRPKWKKRLLRKPGKRGEKAVKSLEETEPPEEQEPHAKVEAKKVPWTLEACFAGKRKMGEGEPTEASEVPQKGPAKGPGLLRFNFQRISKEDEKETQELPPDEVKLECPKKDWRTTADPEAEAEVEAMVVDLEAKRPKFNWKDSFAKLSVAPAGPAWKASQAPEDPSATAREAEVLEIPDSSPKGASKCNKQGSKKASQSLCSKAPLVVDWCERYVPSQQKQLKPQKAWQEFREWLRTWRPNRKGKEAALVTGPCGSGKTAGVRFTVRKLRKQFIEYDLADLQGRSFLENLAKKQRNGNQLSEDAMAQVLICNISEHITAAQKECLAMAVQASPGPVIFTTAEGILGPKDAIYKMCLEIRIALSETFVAKQIHEISRKESLTLPLELCHTVSTACPGDLRKALQVAQLLSVLSGSGQACLPKAACAPLTACDRLLRREAEKALDLEEALSLVELEEEVPMLLRWNLLPALSYAWTQRRSSEEVQLLVASMGVEEEAAKEEKLETEHEEDPDVSADTGDVEMAADEVFLEPEVLTKNLVFQMNGTKKKCHPPQEAEMSEEAQVAEHIEMEDPKDAQQSTEKEAEMSEEAQVAEHIEMEAEMSEEAQVAEHIEMEDLADDDDDLPPEDKEDKAESSQEVMPKPATEEELRDLETCARISSFLALSDVAGGLALQASEQAGPTIDVAPAEAEPLLLAILSREAQDFGSSSQARKSKRFQSMKALPDPVCPISMDQVAMLALQLNVPKAWIVDRLYDWILGSRSNHVSSRHLKNFKTWLKRQVQVWQQRQGRQRQEKVMGSGSVLCDPDSNDLTENSDPAPVQSEALTMEDAEDAEVAEVAEDL